MGRGGRLHSLCPTGTHRAGSRQRGWSLCSCSFLPACAGLVQFSCHRTWAGSWVSSSFCTLEGSAGQDVASSPPRSLPVAFPLPCKRVRIEKCSREIPLSRVRGALGGPRRWESSWRCSEELAGSLLRGRDGTQTPCLTLTRSLIRKRCKLLASLALFSQVERRSRPVAFVCPHFYLADEPFLHLFRKRTNEGRELRSCGVVLWESDRVEPIQCGVLLQQVLLCLQPCTPVVLLLSSCSACSVPCSW